MRIVVLAGGLSTERDVSISSGIKVASALREKGNEVVLLDVFMGYEENFCDIDALFKHNYSFTDSLGVGTEIPDIKTVKENRLDKSSKFIGMNVIEICAEADITYLALHGGEGENGQIQATLDLFGIKYTGSGYLGSALAMNKALTKSVLIQNRVTTPAGRVYKSAQDAEDWSYYPCVVKPCSGGSSVGITKAENRAEYLESVKEAFKYEKEIVVEQFVEGREFSVGVIGGRALPLRLRLFLRQVSTIMWQSIRQAQQTKFALLTLLQARMMFFVKLPRLRLRLSTCRAMQELTLFLIKYRVRLIVLRQTHFPV